MKRGSTIPKGRFNLPREPKSKSKDRVFVFAEGKQAEEAKRAGAEFVGGPELIEGVPFAVYALLCHLKKDRSLTADILQQCIFALLR